MSTKKLSVGNAQEALDALVTHGNAIAAAKALGLPRTTFCDRVDSAKRYGLSSTCEAQDSPRKLKEQVKTLKAALAREQSQSASNDLVRDVIKLAASQVNTLDIPDWVTRPQKRDSAPGVPTLFLSDFHWGEVVHPSQINGVNKFNLAIARNRLDSCISRAVHLLKIISPKMEYPGLVVLLGGDMISGNIHEELMVTNEVNTMPAVLDLYGALSGAIESLADTFGSVLLCCVTGNHGRDTHRIYSKDRHATSFDWLLYNFLAKRFEKDKRIQFYIPDGPDAYYRIYEHRYLLSHGDQFRGGDGMIGALGPIIRGDHKKRSRNAQIDMEYDTMCLGHWHQYMHLTRLIVNGALKGYDEYAYAGNFPFELPQQALWLTHPKYRITYRMPVYVDQLRNPPKTAWASVAA